MDMTQVVFLADNVAKATGSDRNANLETLKNLFNAGVEQWKDKVVAAGDDQEKLMALWQEMRAYILDLQETAALIVTNVIVPIKQNVAAAVVLSGDVLAKASEKTRRELIARDNAGEAREIVNRITPKDDTKTPKLSAVEKAQIKIAERLILEGIPSDKVADIVKIMSGFIAAGMNEETSLKMAKSAFGL